MSLPAPASALVPIGGGGGFQAFEQYLAALGAGGGAASQQQLALLSDQTRAQMQAVVARAMQQLGRIQADASAEKADVEAADRRVASLRRNKDKWALWRALTLRHEFGVGEAMEVVELQVLVTRPFTEREEESESAIEALGDNELDEFGGDGFGKRIPVVIALPSSYASELMSEDDCSLGDEGFAAAYEHLWKVAIAKGRLKASAGWEAVDDPIHYDGCGINHSREFKPSEVTNDLLIDAIVIPQQSLRRNQFGNNTAVVVLDRFTCSGADKYPSRFFWRDEPRHLGDRDDPETDPSQFDEDERGVLLNDEAQQESPAAKKRKNPAVQEKAARKKPCRRVDVEGID